MKCEDNEICMIIHGLSIKQSSNGDVEINDMPRVITASPSDKSLSLKTQYVDIQIKVGSTMTLLPRTEHQAVLQR